MCLCAIKLHMASLEHITDFDASLLVTCNQKLFYKYCSVLFLCLLDCSCITRHIFI